MAIVTTITNATAGRPNWATATLSGDSGETEVSGTITVQGNDGTITVDESVVLSGATDFGEALAQLAAQVNANVPLVEAMATAHRAVVGDPVFGGGEDADSLLGTLSIRSQVSGPESAQFTLTALTVA